MSTTTTTTTTTTTEDDIYEIQYTYQDIFYRRMPQVHLKQALYYAELFGPMTVLAILRETSEAPTPSWRYFLKICGKCHFDEVRSFNDYLVRKSNFLRSKATTRNV